MTLKTGVHQPPITEQRINLLNFLPNDVKCPVIQEGEKLLTITSCKIIPTPQGYNKVRERIEVDFIDEESHSLRQIFYRDIGMVNFAKFIEDIFGEVVWEDFDLNSLLGVKIKAFIYHNYLSNGKGYANIATCELYEQNQSESETR